eukprot:scaffold1355_cov165-Chaetoceros_neogracile.AAC.1
MAAGCWLLAMPADMHQIWQSSFNCTKVLFTAANASTGVVVAQAYDHTEDMAVGLFATLAQAYAK